MAPGDDARAGQHRGGPVRDRGEGQGHRQRVPERRIGELKARIHRPQDPRPGIIDPRVQATRPVDDLYAGQLGQADRAATRCRVSRRNPHVRFEISQAHGVERDGQRLGADRQPAQAGVSPALQDHRESGVEGGFHPDDIHVRRGRRGRRGSQRGGGLDGEGIGQPGRHDHAQPWPAQAGRLPGPVHLMLHQRQHGAGGVQQHHAGLRHLKALAAAVQQRRADDLFQPPDLLAQGWLGDEHPLRGVSEAACIGDRGEVTQVAQLDCLRRPCRPGPPDRLRLSMLHAGPLADALIRSGGHDHFRLPSAGRRCVTSSSSPGPADAPLKALDRILVRG